MKKIFICIGIFVVVTAFAAVSEVYVVGITKDMAALLTAAEEAYSAGEHGMEEAAAYIERARDMWEGLSEKRSLLVADLTDFDNVSTAVRRLEYIVRYPDDRRFAEECGIAVLALQNFISGN